jgi:protein phosphatase
MQLDAEGIKFRGDVVDFLQKLPSLLLMDAGALVLTHAGLKTPSVDGEALTPRDLEAPSENSGKRDKSGQSPRVSWADAYRGQALVVYGHTPVAEPVWLNRTVNIDTGCVFGGHLTALRYPELETVRVAARQIYRPSRRRFLLNPKLLLN